MVGQPFSDTASLTHKTQLCARHATAASTVKDKVVAFSSHCLPFVPFLLRLALIDDGLRYRVQWHNKLHLCFLPFLSNITCTLR